MFTKSAIGETVAQPQHPPDHPDHPDYSGPIYLPPGHVERLHASDHATSPSADGRPGEEPQDAPEGQPLDQD
jgi:hypothetical protein